MFYLWSISARIKDTYVLIEETLKYSKYKVTYNLIVKKLSYTITYHHEMNYQMFFSISIPIKSEN